MLLLKNEIKELFKKAGLEEFTVGRDGMGHLNIVGPCGKPLVPITNFAIGAKLTKQEREICIDDHIKPVLIAHTATIIGLIKTKEDEAAAKVVYDFAEDLVKKDGFYISFGVNTRYGMNIDKSDTYNALVSINGDADSEYVHAKVSYASSEDKLTYTTECRDVKNVDVVASMTKDCKIKFDGLRVLFEDYMAHGDASRIAADKLRIECSL